MTPLDRTYAAVEREDEDVRNERAKAIYDTYPSHTDRVQAARLVARNDQDFKDLEERLLDLEAGQAIEKAARYYLWDLQTLEQRERWIAVRTQEMNKERPHAGTVWARRVQKRARQLARKSARLEP